MQARLDHNSTYKSSLSLVRILINVECCWGVDSIALASVVDDGLFFPGTKTLPVHACPSSCALAFKFVLATNIGGTDRFLTCHHDNLKHGQKTPHLDLT